jgi:cobalt-zinc-cadmium efflux system membrane fusion protein
LIGISPDYIKKNGILSEVNIVSPINGFLAESYVSIGDAVHETKLLFEIIDNSYMHIVLRVPVSKIGYVKEGQECVFGLNTGQETIKGKVHLIGKKANSANGTVEVHVDPLVNDSHLVVGSNVFARIFTGTDTVPAILTSELIRKGDDFFIYKEIGKNWALHKIIPGISNDEFTEITNEELKNVKVILKGNYFLSNE